MAGHSKWANIQHRKGRQDAKRGQVWTKIIREITVAARQGGDPTMNSRLRLALDKASAANVPKDTVNKAIALLGYKGRIVGHGFRATASTILNESREFHPDVIERQLAHKDRDEIRAIYDRAEHLEQRTRLMQWWADKLDTLTTRNVVALRKKA